MAMGKTLAWVSVTVCLLAVFFTLDTFAPLRGQLSKFIPRSVKRALNKAKLTVTSKLSPSERLFTKEELSQYTGEKGDIVYIGILGQVFDVSKGIKHYGPGGGYSFFAGRDGSRAFVSGDFTEKGLIDDVSGFSTTEVTSLEDWKDFYHKDYTYVGKLIGYFYDAKGKPTEAMKLYQETLGEARAEKQAAEKLREIFPPCNSHWTQTRASLSCSNRSGGVQRDWVGVPRQYMQPGKVDPHPRCVCVRITGPPSDNPNSKDHKNRGDLDHPNLKAYEKCDPMSEVCAFDRTDDN